MRETILEILRPVPTTSDDTDEHFVELLTNIEIDGEEYSASVTVVRDCGYWPRGRLFEVDLLPLELHVAKQRAEISQPWLGVLTVNKETNTTLYWTERERSAIALGILTEALRAASRDPEISVSSLIKSIARAAEALS